MDLSHAEAQNNCSDCLKSQAIVNKKPGLAAFKNWKTLQADSMASDKLIRLYSYFQVNRPRNKGTALLIGVNLSANPFKTSFPARGWKCCSWRLCRQQGRRSLTLGIPSRRLGTR
ncbi:MAG: hypothetical protein V7K62_25875 [Nostoc sp.]